MISPVAPQESNSLLAHRYGQVLKIMFGKERLCCIEQGRRLLHRYASGCRKLSEIRTYGRRTVVLAEVFSLWISQHRNTCCAGRSNHRLAELTSERTFGV